MKKHKLPKNWIVVNSQSRPERVYYFNVRTKQSSWVEPTLDETDQSAAKSLTMPRKRKTQEEDVPEFKPTTPEGDGIKDQGERKKLRARRSVQVVQVAENKAKETPQMQVLRDKISQKKGKDQSVRKSLSKSSDGKLKLPSIMHDASDASREVSPSKNVSFDKSAASPPRQEGFTPQMRVIHERIMQRKAKSVSSRKSDVSDVKSSSSPSSNTTSRSKKSRRRTIAVDSKTSTGTSTSTSTSTSESTSTSATYTTQSKQKKVIGQSPTHPPVSPRQKVKDTSPTRPEVKKRRSRNVEKSPRTNNRRVSSVSQPSSLKKNIANERMDNLRKSLDFENKNHAFVTKTPVSIYKNVQVRLQRLHSKLIKDYSSSEANGAQSSKRTKNDHARTSSSNEITTAEDLVQECIQTQYEEMDWEPMEDEKVMFEVQSIRNHLGTERHAGQSNFVPERTLDVPLGTEEEQQHQMLYIVVDTNVLLSNISAVEEVKDTAFKIYGRPIIVIPWTVIRELDYIKDDKSNTRSEALRSNARKAVRFLNQYFAAKHPRVVGQKYEDVVRNKEKYAVDCPDDEILQTCLQIRELNNAVVLLSYDKNLCNKAMIHDIVTIGRNDPVEKVDYLNASENSFLNLHSQTVVGSGRLSLSTVEEELVVADEIYEDAKDVLKNFLTVIVVKEMQSLYSNNWEKYTIIRPPWTTYKVLKCAIKHWIAAVSESFLRQAEPILKDLLEIVSKQPDGGNRLDDVARMLEKCGDLIQMVHVHKYPDLMARASDSIDELKQKCLKYDIRIREKRLQEEIGYENDVNEQERRAAKAFQYFEAVYSYARDIGGYAAEAVGMPCSFFYKTPCPVPDLDSIRRIQPEIAANVNRLLQSLGTAMKQVNDSCVDRRTLIALYHALTTFLSEALTAVPDDFEPLDVYCCLKRKERSLKTGISQLQEISTHYCRLASYRCT